VLSTGLSTTGSSGDISILTGSSPSLHFPAPHRGRGLDKRPSSSPPLFIGQPPRCFSSTIT
jgi:hypothetical protein